MMATLIGILMIMLGYFLMLYSVVGLIQDKRLCSSAPKENLDALPEKIPERFPGAHVLGWCVMVLALGLFVGAAVLAVTDGMKNGFGFFAFFGRFLLMLYVMEIYDILFFDWYLLCHSNFFPHFYPQLKGVVGPQMFGYNKKQHLIHFLVYIPACAAAAGLCLLL